MVLLVLAKHRRGRQLLSQPVTQLLGRFHVILGGGPKSGQLPLFLYFTIREQLLHGSFGSLGIAKPKFIDLVEFSIERLVACLIPRQRGVPDPIHRVACVGEW